MKIYVSKSELVNPSIFGNYTIERSVKLSRKVFEGTLAECEAIAKSVDIRYRIYARSTKGNYVNDHSHRNCRAKTTKFALYFFISA